MYPSVGVRSGALVGVELELVCSHRLGRDGGFSYSVSSDMRWLVMIGTCAEGPRAMRKDDKGPRLQTLVVWPRVTHGSVRPCHVQLGDRQPFTVASDGVVGLIRGKCHEMRSWKSMIGECDSFWIGSLRQRTSAASILPGITPRPRNSE